MTKSVDDASVTGLAVTLDAGVLSITLDRPDKRNAIDDVMMDGLLRALTLASTDDRVRAILLTGAGDHFCGGADIVARNTRDPEAAKPRAGSIQRRVPTQAHHLIPLVLEIQVPVVCKVRGFAAGIGLSLALAADFTIAADDARLWEPFVPRGFTPDSGATWLLPRRVGELRAREMLILGRELTGARAVEWGAIHAAVPGADLDAAAGALVAQLAGGPSVALGLTKWLLHAGREVALNQQLRNEVFALELSSRTDDFREGLAAFREKRDPDFQGR
jgi:2-(1,2-epoxy-1,2-dihydrophenyl)acetyl-CoA isomerase